MVNPKKNLLMGLEVTEGSQKKPKNGQDNWTASPVVVARKSCLRKAFPGDGCRGDMAKEPMVQQAGTPAESPVLLQD